MLRQIQQLNTSIRGLANAASAMAQIQEVVHENVSTPQIEYLKERCIAVSEKDKIIGSVSKGKSHQKGTSVLHRAFSVFVFNPDKELLLQQRAPTKITFPLRWTNSCCSHPLFTEQEIEGETGVRHAAQRKLYHELGISASHCALHDFKMVGKFIYSADSDENWTEHELDYVLILKNYTGPLELNLDEAAAVKYVSHEEFTELYDQDPSNFSPWFGLLHSKGWLAKWWHDLDDLSEHVLASKTIHRLN
uniref:isopentenyl-diphosphate Delta-isomerase n=1 Tax=Panagrellus redivivus TaxID=6233 RepID=A0A7E4VLT1_PANRE